MNETEGFIAVHLGAGKHSESLKDNYFKLGKEACQKGIEALQSSYNVLDAVTKAVMILEDSPMTNSGYGSNLTYDGQVECDASVMNGSDHIYGAVGAITGVQNPVEVAKYLCQHQTVNIGHGRVPPSFLVGPGALLWAKKMGIKSIPPENLISDKAKNAYRHYKRKIDPSFTEINPKLKKRMDTVGAVCVDKYGNIASACSSGGIVLKYPGRVGQAAVWGCGVWASKGSTSVGTSTTGCGEHLIRTTLARNIAESIIETDCPTTSLYNAMKKDFIDSKLLNSINEKLGGVIGIRYSTEDRSGDFLWSHSTHSMIIAYMNSNEKSAVSHLSTLDANDVGKKALVEGMIFKFKK